MELLHRQYQRKKEILNKKRKKDILDKYGQLADEKEEVLEIRQSEQYIEYDKFGRVIKGEIIKARSR